MGLGPSHLQPRPSRVERRIRTQTLIGKTQETGPFGRPGHKPSEKARCPCHRKPRHPHPPQEIQPSFTWGKKTRPYRPTEMDDSQTVDAIGLTVPYGSLLGTSLLQTDRCLVRVHGRFGPQRRYASTNAVRKTTRRTSFAPTSMWGALTLLLPRRRLVRRDGNYSSAQQPGGITTHHAGHEKTTNCAMNGSQSSPVGRHKSNMPDSMSATRAENHGRSCTRTRKGWLQATGRLTPVASFKSFQAISVSPSALSVWIIHKLEWGSVPTLVMSCTPSSCLICTGQKPSCKHVSGMPQPPETILSKDESLRMLCTIQQYYQPACKASRWVQQVQGSKQNKHVDPTSNGTI